MNLPHQYDASCASHGLLQENSYISSLSPHIENATASSSNLVHKAPNGLAITPASVLQSRNGVSHLRPPSLTKPMISTHDYFPKAAPHGVPLRAHININYDSDPGRTVRLRLVFGDRPVATSIHQLGEPGTTSTRYGAWELQAIVPESRWSTPTVVILVQALTDGEVIMDSVPLGSFTYAEHEIHSFDPRMSVRSKRSYDEIHSPLQSPLASTPKRTRYVQTDNTRQLGTAHYSNPNAMSARAAQKRRSPEPSFTSPKRVHLDDQIQSPADPLHSQSTVQALMRTHAPGPGEHGGNTFAQRAVLQVLTPFDAMAADWDAIEREIGRRLVRFNVEREEHMLRVSCERIDHSEYDEKDTVVSCIYRAENGMCYITSVDIIYLLERLVDTVFKVEEKNRVRRNLEGLKPMTMSKHKRGCQEFFQKIMDFPNPKPRTIEKDLKVFEWRLLEQALQKIISRYSLYTRTVDHSVASAFSSMDPRAQTSYSESAFEHEPMGCGMQRPTMYHSMSAPPPPSEYRCRSPRLVNNEYSDYRNHPNSPFFVDALLMAAANGRDRNAIHSIGSIEANGLDNDRWTPNSNTNTYGTTEPAMFAPPLVSPDESARYSAGSDSVDDFSNSTSQEFSLREPSDCQSSILHYYM